MSGTRVLQHFDNSVEDIYAYFKHPYAYFAFEGGKSRIMVWATQIDNHITLRKDFPVGTNLFEVYQATYVSSNNFLTPYVACILSNGKNVLVYYHHNGVGYPQYLPYPNQSGMLAIRRTDNNHVTSGACPSYNAFYKHTFSLDPATGVLKYYLDGVEKYSENVGVGVSIVAYESNPINGWNNIYYTGYIDWLAYEFIPPLNFKCKIDGSIKNSDKGYAKVNGVWKDIDKVFSNIDGVWKSQ